MDKPKQSLPWWTWVLPFLIFHLGSVLSVQLQMSEGMSLWYLPVPFGLILIHWWGPRVLVGLFLNSMFCAGYWGLSRWWLWPLYALPETLKVGLSWWLFIQVFKGKPWLPDLSNLLRFLIFAIVVPSFISSLFGTGQMVLLGDSKPGSMFHNAYLLFVLDILCPFAITVPAILFGTSFMEKINLSVTRGAYPRAPFTFLNHFNKWMTYELLFLFGSLLIASVCFSLKVHLYVHGVFLIWIALRFGMGLTAVGIMWSIFLAVLLPALISLHVPGSWSSQADLVMLNSNLVTLCIAALVVSRALSDVFQEIEFRKQVAAELKTEEKKYRTLFESAFDPLIIAEDGIFIDCNERALTLFGATREELIGSPSYRFFPATLENGKDARTEIARIREAALAGLPQAFSLKINRLNGEVFDSEIAFVGLTLNGKKVILSVIRDVTDFKRAQEEARKHQQLLIQQDKMNSLGQMVSGVAHEINNPNNLIMLNADVLETFWKYTRPVLREHSMHNPDWNLAGLPLSIAEGKYESLLHGVIGGSKRIKRIVDNLKDFARIDPGELSESVSLEKVIEAAVGIVDNLIQKSTDRFMIYPGENVPLIRGNFQKLEQVVINLLTNACQALESRSKSISVHTWFEKESQQIGIRVEDQGRGIPNHLLASVTDPFFTTKRDTGGTGLGLSVSYGIIREHQGTMEIHSKENHGTKVEILLPAWT